MAPKKKEDFDNKIETSEEKVEDSKKEEAKGVPIKEVATKEDMKKVVKLEKPEPLISFNRWFVSKGYKPHWKKGMMVFADTTGKRTLSDWAELFKNY